MAQYEISPELTRQMQEVGLKMLLYFDTFCRENNLTWFFCGGCCIGTVRDHGFIPWDDDVDIFMPRPDYEKLKELWVDTPKYTIQYPNESVCTANQFVTICDEETTFIKTFQKDLDIRHGVMLDILPLDGCPAGWRRKTQKLYALAYSLFVVGKPPENHGKVVTALGKLALGVVRSWPMRCKIWRFCERRMSRYSFDSCQYITELCAGPRYMQNEYPRRCFEKVQRMDFEGHKLCMPGDYDTYLCMAFGDYMQLPPPEKRICHHEYEVIDLEHSYRAYRGKAYCCYAVRNSMARKRGCLQQKKYIWFILFAALYYHSIMFNGMRMVTYAYYYLFPLAYLLLHIDWLIEKLSRLLRGKLLYIPICVSVMLLYGVLVPLIKGTGDYSYLFDGPIWWLLQSFFISLFLLCIYEKVVTDRPHTTGFMACYIASQSCYILGTGLILTLPGARQWITTHIHMTALQAEVVGRAEHISRIGWSGFSGFVPTMQCSICVVFCAYLLFRYKHDRVRTRQCNALLLISLAGNLCYGRVGVVTSLVCFVLYLLCLLLVKPERTLLYPVVFLVLMGAVILLAQYKESMRSWFEWSFSQVLSFLRTGSFETYTISNLKNMYQMPSLETIIFGDGLYTEGDHYYMHTDVGWLRPVYFYGIVPSISSFLLAICGILCLRHHLTGVLKRESAMVVCMLLLTYLLFESKGEAFYVFAATLIPLLLVGDNNTEVSYTGCLEGSAAYDNGIDERI